MQHRNRRPVAALPLRVRRQICRVVLQPTVNTTLYVIRDWHVVPNGYPLA
jgi:hypothetical protein